MRKFLLLAIALCTLRFSHAQSVKGLYVDGFSSILGNIQAEDSLLTYAQVNSFTYLALYELQIVQTQHDLTNFSSSAPLAAFINKAKTQYGIQQVGAVAENYWFFANRINVYNQQHSNPAEQFDVFNLEFEFWQTAATGPSGYYCTTYLQPSGYSCDTAGAFAFYINELHRIDSLAQLGGKISETYVGWPTAGQCHQIATIADRILIHAYVTNPSTAYSYTQTRLSYFATSAGAPTVLIIFSAEPSFMGPWLTTNPETGAYTQWSNGFANETAAWTSNINVAGYQWFAYSFMPYDLSMGDPDPKPVFCYIITDEEGIHLNPSPDAERTYAVYNCVGALVVETKQNSGEVTIPLTHCASGTYVLRITNESTGEVNCRKIFYPGKN